MEYLLVQADVFLRLLVAALLGGIIGLEREIYGKDAGLRTYMLVSMGSALIMIVSIESFEMYKGVANTLDPTRIAAQVVTGVGFLGAGAIMRFHEGVRGLTTAAGIWAVAGIGLACGIRLYSAAVMTTLLVLVILFVFSRLNHIILKKNHTDRL